MRWTKYIGYIVSMCIIYVVMNYLYSRDNVSHDKGQNEFHYVIQLPKVIKTIYSLVFFMGVILTLFFVVVKVKWDGGVTVGHVRFGLILTVIGIIIMIVASKWKVVVDGEMLTVSSFGRGKREIRISDIDEVEEGAEGEFTLYQNGKKITTVENLSENYDRFKETLKRYGKIR